MSDSANSVLTREELEAVRAAVAASSVDDPRMRREAGATDAQRFAWSPLARALRGFGEDTGRSLSTLFQRTLRFTLIDLRSLPADDFAASMLSTDSPVLLRFAPSGSAGAVLIGRTLLYGWLTLRFGGDVGEAPLFVPTRRYSRIETKQLLRGADELLARLPRALAPIVATELELGAPYEPELLAGEVAPRLWVASYEATGFGELGRLRVALPDSLFGRVKEARPAARDYAAIGERLHEMPVRISAEVGSADLTLRRVRDLCIGDVLVLKPSATDGVLVRVEGQPKFRAARGQLGPQAAVRITERL
jgi:flagellar motor switch protein FliM